MSPAEIIHCFANEENNDDVINLVSRLILSTFNSESISLNLESVELSLENQFSKKYSNDKIPPKLFFVAHGLKEKRLFTCWDKKKKERVYISENFFTSDTENQKLGFFFSCHSFDILSQEKWCSLLDDWIGFEGKISFNGLMGDNKVDQVWQAVFHNIFKEMTNETAYSTDIVKNLQEYFKLLQEKFDLQGMINTAFCFDELGEKIRGKFHSNVT